MGKVLGTQPLDGGLGWVPGDFPWTPKWNPSQGPPSDHTQTQPLETGAPKPWPQPLASVTLPDQMSICHLVPMASLGQ